MHKHNGDGDVVVRFEFECLGILGIFVISYHIIHAEAYADNQHRRRRRRRCGRLCHGCFHS